MFNGISTSTVFFILAICIVIACGAFMAALYLTRKSRNDAHREIEAGIEELSKVIALAKERIGKLDQQVIDSFQPLSSVAQENFSLVKQFVSLMESRRVRVRDLVDSRRLEELFRAQRIISSPLENAGDHLTSVVFADTVLHLEPGQFEIAVSTMLNSVEQELAGNPGLISTRVRSNTRARKRKFTIRGFIQSVTGAEDEEKK